MIEVTYTKNGNRISAMKNKKVKKFIKKNLQKLFFAGVTNATDLLIIFFLKRGVVENTNTGFWIFPDEDRHLSLTFKAQEKMFLQDVNSEIEDYISFVNKNS